MKKDEANLYLKENVFENVSNTKKKKKIKDDEFKIIKMNEYEKIITYQYKIIHLKEICTHYKLKKSGNKDELINRIYNYLKYSLFTIKIQKLIRGKLLRKYIKYGGPGLMNRELCVNDTDFATLEEIKLIPYNQFYSFTCNNNVYGFNLISLYSLISKSNQGIINRNQDNTKLNMINNTLNPYTREKIDDKTIKKFFKYLLLATANNIEYEIEEEVEELDPKKIMELKILDIFQHINELGNYADSKWFTDLSQMRVVLFIREVYDIWYYRAQLSVETRRAIIPPHGNPFIGLNLHLVQNQTEANTQKCALRIIESLVKSGHNNENRALGAIYVLCALTLVSEDARTALPWLFQSVAPFVAP